jgi:transcriptional regulator with XRE-family HTH domain
LTSGRGGITLSGMLDTDKMRALREKRGLTQDAAATRAGFKSRQAWNNIESGRHATVTLQTLDRIAEALGVKAKDLLK